MSSNAQTQISRLKILIFDYIAGKLQASVREEEKEERKNPEIFFTEGWVRVFDSEHYSKVLDMGPAAMKPLYWIIYKSPNAGMYEYICANALYENANRIPSSSKVLFKAISVGKIANAKISTLQEAIQISFLIL